MAETMKQLGKFGTLTPKSNDAFQAWNAIAFKEGALSQRLKEIMAVACAATTGCEFCLDLHSKAAKRAGVTEEEIAEALMLATASKAGAAFAHGANALNAFDGIEDDEYFKRSYMPKMMELKSLAPEDFKGFMGFTMTAGTESTLTTKERELITTATAIILSCPYCIDTHVTNAKNEGATKEEIAETVFIASALNAGSAWTKAAPALKNYDK